MANEVVSLDALNHWWTLGCGDPLWHLRQKFFGKVTHYIVQRHLHDVDRQHASLRK